MKRHIIIMYMALVLLSGCGGRTTGWQTGNVALVRTVGVDCGETGVMLTACGGEEDAPLALEAGGTSVADGLRNLRGMGDNMVHLGHADHLLLGEEFVRSGTEELVAHVARDRTIGPGARLWVLRDDSARQGMLNGESNVTARLERLARDCEAGVKIDCSVTRLMSALAEGGSVSVPALRLERGTLQPAGYAILRCGRLVGFLEGEQSLGLELLSKQGTGQLVDVGLSDETRVILSVERVELQCVPQTVAGQVSGADVRSVVRLGVAQGVPLTAEQRRQAERQAEVALCGRMAAALACAQFWDADFVGVGQMLDMAGVMRERDGVDFRAMALRVTATAKVAWPADMVEGE